MGKETKSLSFFQLGRCRPIAYLGLTAAGPHQTEHCVLHITYLYVHRVCVLFTVDSRVGWYQKKGDKKTGCPPDPHKHQIFTQATGLDQTCLLLWALSLWALSMISAGCFKKWFSHTHIIHPPRQRVACSNNLLFCFSIDFLSAQMRQMILRPACHLWSFRAIVGSCVSSRTC